MQQGLHQGGFTIGLICTCNNSKRSGQQYIAWCSCCIMGVTLTQRVGEFLHVLVQVLMKAGQLLDVPAGRCFKQPVDVKRLAVSLVVRLRLTSNRSLNSKCFTDNRVTKKLCGSKGQAVALINTAGLENTQQIWYNGYYRRQRAVCLRMGRLTCQSGD